MKKCIKVRVYGIVQGVGYREFIKQHATKHAVAGSATNGEDGSVTLYLYGSPESVDAVLDEVYIGTSESRIDEVIIEMVNISPDFRNVFRIIGVE